VRELVTVDGREGEQRRVEARAEQGDVHEEELVVGHRGDVADTCVGEPEQRADEEERHRVDASLTRPPHERVVVVDPHAVHLDGVALDVGEGERPHPAGPDPDRSSPEGPSALSPGR
jgi:hypothetical protein